MIKRLVGDKAYRDALDLYFDTYDGQAVTIEDWIKVFEDVTELDLSQFILWYQQAGTQFLSASERWENNFLKLFFSTKKFPIHLGSITKNHTLYPWI